MSIRPQTMQADIGERVFGLLDAGRLIPEDDPSVLDLWDRLDKFREADPLGAKILKAYVHQLTGDLEAALESLKGMEGPQVQNARGAIYSNLGYAVEAFPYYRDVGRPEEGQCSFFVPFGLAVGAIQTVHNFTSQAKRMGLVYQNSVPVDEIALAAHILQQCGVSDHELGQIVSVAGGVLRDYGLSFVGHVGLSVHDIPEVSRLVSLSYQVAVDTDTATALYLEYVHRITEADLRMPECVLISFQGMNS